MKIFLVIAILAVLLIIFFFIFGYLCFRRTCKRNPKRDPYSRGYIDIDKYAPYDKEMKSALEAYEKLEKETVYIDSVDSIRLAASFISAQKPTKKIIIAFHGYRSCAAADFSPIASSLIKEGFSLLLPDQRAHGRSEGKYITFGAFERLDCGSWCEYVRERFGEDTEIYLYGVSMGAATVLMSSETELCENVRGIIADCGFTSPWDIIKNTLIHKYKIPVYPVIYFMNLYSRILARFDFKEVSSVAAMKKNVLPILFIHGNEDLYVPVYMSQRISEACGEKGRLLLFDGARHARSYLSDSQRYLDELKAFFNF